MERRDFLKNSLLISGTAGLALASIKTEATESLAGVAGTKRARCPRTADILIRAGELYNGTDPLPVTSDIAIVGERIAYVGKADPRIESHCKAA